MLESKKTALMEPLTLVARVVDDVSDGRVIAKNGKGSCEIGLVSTNCTTRHHLLGEGEREHINGCQ